MKPRCVNLQVAEVTRPAWAGTTLVSMANQLLEAALAVPTKLAAWAEDDQFIQAQLQFTITEWDPEHPTLAPDPFKEAVLALAAEVPEDFPNRADIQKWLTWRAEQ